MRILGLSYFHRIVVLTCARVSHPFGWIGSARPVREKLKKKSAGAAAKGEERSRRPGLARPRAGHRARGANKSGQESPNRLQAS